MRNKIENLSSQILTTRKKNCYHYGTKVKNGVFLKLFWGFRFWTFLKCPFFISLFTFWNFFVTEK
jgi:hypothetical protein